MRLSHFAFYGRGALGKNFFLVACLAVLSCSFPVRALTVQNVVSPGGIKAWLVEDHSIPVVSMQFGFDGGALTDPNGKEGRASLAAALFIEGGAGDMTGQELQQRLARRAIRLSFKGALEDTTGLLKTTVENRQEAFKLLGLILSQSRFEPEAFSRVQSQHLADLKRSYERPGTLAGLRMSKVLYGDHPYARPVRGTVESVSSLRSEDMKAFAEAALARDRLKIGVTGAISPDDLGVLLDQAFVGLPASSRVDVPRTAPDVSVQLGGQVDHIKMDVPQSDVVFADVGVGYHDPDFHAASVLNYVLGGGGFASRLVDEVREKRGLVYGIRTSFVNYDKASLLAGSFATDGARVDETISLVRQEWTRMRQEGPTSAELEAAKKHMIGSWPLKFTSTDRIADFLHFLQDHGLPENYFEKRNEYIQAVTMEDVRRVASRLLDPDRLMFFVAGRSEERKSPSETPS